MAEVQPKFSIGQRVRSVRRPDRIGKVFDIEQIDGGFNYFVTWEKTHTTTTAPESALSAWVTA